MKAVIYCRVSTDEEIQVNALKGQVKEARNAVHREGWILVDQYIDEGKSGTTTKQRTEYNRLVLDMDREIFDVIVVKSQDRLMRNTKEWYVFVDRLVQAHKQLYFYLENQFYTPDDALITGIKAILAEEYSRELSKKINNAHKYRQEKGTNVSITSNTWGYDKVNKQVVINESEAEIVRLIYDLCIEGYGSRIIAKKLVERGIKSRSGGPFQEATVRRIIRNPLFKGTAVMNKRHLDFNTKKSMPIKEDSWCYHEHIVPAIVSEEVWKKANESMNQRVVMGPSSSKGKKCGKHPLSGKILCGECNSVYWLRVRTNVKGEKIKEWCCSEYVQRGRTTIESSNTLEQPRNHQSGCNNIHIKDCELQDLLMQVGQQFYGAGNSEQTKALVLSILQTVVMANQKEVLEAAEKKCKSIANKRELLLDKLLENKVSEETYQSKDHQLKNEYNQIHTKRNQMRKDVESKTSVAERMKKMREKINEITGEHFVLSKLYEQIISITLYKDHGVISVQSHQDIGFSITKINHRKTILYVDTSI